MSMKRVVLGLVVVLALGMVVGPSHAFIFGGNGCCAAVAPYEVKVSYTPIQPQPGECTYCTVLPYGCPDGAPITNGCPPGNSGLLGLGGGACGLNLGCLNPCGIVSGAVGVVGNVLNGACSLVGGVLGCLGNVGGAAGCSSCGAAPVAQ